MIAKRIALLFEYPTLNGGERSMLAVLDRLRAGAADAVNEFQFTAIAPPTGPLAEAMNSRGIDVRPLRIRDDDGRRLPLERSLNNLRTTLSSSNADLIHANSLAMGRLSGALGDDFGMRRIAHLRDIIGLSRAAIADLNRNDRLIAVSAATRNFHLAQGLDAGKTAVIFNGVDCDLFQPRAKTGELKTELGLPKSVFLVLTVGQIGLRKGQDVLADAAILLANGQFREGDQFWEGEAPNDHSNIHFVVVGERNSNKQESIDFERNLAQRFAAAGMSDRLHLPGYRYDVPRLMNEADLLVHPAHHEPLGRVLLEAAASGLPIIATNVGGTPEILTDGVSARLVPPGDPQAMAVAIAELTSSPERSRELAVAARQRIVEQFTIDHATRELAAVWR